MVGQTPLLLCNMITVLYGLEFSHDQCLTSNSYNTGRRDVLDLLTEPEGA